MSFIDYNFFPILFFLGWNILTTKQFRPNISSTSRVKTLPGLSVFSFESPLSQASLFLNQKHRPGHIFDGSKMRDLKEGIITHSINQKTLQSYVNYPKTSHILEFIPEFRFLSENQKLITIPQTNTTCSENQTRDESIFKNKPFNNSFLKEFYNSSQAKRHFDTNVKKDTASPVVSLSAKPWGGTQQIEEGKKRKLKHPILTPSNKHSPRVNTRGERGPCFPKNRGCLDGETTVYKKEKFIINYIAKPTKWFINENKTHYLTNSNLINNDWKKDFKSNLFNLAYRPKRKAFLSFFSYYKIKPIFPEIELSINSLSALPRDLPTQNKHEMRPPDGFVRQENAKKNNDYNQNSSMFTSSFLGIKANTKALNNMFLIQKRRAKIRLLLRASNQNVYSLNQFQIPLCFSKIFKPPTTGFKRVNTGFLELDNSTFNTVKNELPSQNIFSTRLRRETGFLPSSEGTDRYFVKSDQETDHVGSHPIALHGVERQAKPDNYKKRKKNWYMKTQFFQHVAWNMKHSILDHFSNFEYLLPTNDSSVKNNNFVTKLSDQNKKSSLNKHHFSEEPKKTLQGYTICQNYFLRIYAGSWYYENLAFPYSIFNTIKKTPLLPLHCESIFNYWQQVFFKQKNVTPRLNGYIRLFNEHSSRVGTRGQRGLCFKGCLDDQIIQSNHNNSKALPVVSSQYVLEQNIQDVAKPWSGTQNYKKDPFFEKSQIRLESDIGIYSLAHKLSSVGFRNGNNSSNIYPWRYNDSYRYNFQNMNLSNQGLKDFLGFSNFASARNQNRDPFVFSKKNTNAEQNLTRDKKTHFFNFRNFLDFQNPIFSKIYAPIFQPKDLNLLSFLTNSFLNVMPNSIFNSRSGGSMPFFRFHSIASRRVKRQAKPHFFRKTEQTCHTVDCFLPDQIQPIINNYPHDLKNSVRFQNTPKKSKMLNSLYHKLPINGIHTNPYPWITQNAFDRWSASDSLWTLSDPPRNGFFSLKSSLYKLGSVKFLNPFGTSYKKKSGNTRSSRLTTSPAGADRKFSTLSQKLSLKNPPRGGSQLNFTEKASCIKKPSIFFSSFRYLPYFFICETPSGRAEPRQKNFFPQANLSRFLRVDSYNHQLKKPIVSPSNEHSPRVNTRGERGPCFLENRGCLDGVISPSNKLDGVKNKYSDLSIPQYDLFNNNIFKENQKKQVLQTWNGSLQHKSFSLKPLSTFVKKEFGYQTSLFSWASQESSKNNKKISARAENYWPNHNSTQKTNLVPVQKNTWKVFPPLFQPLTFRFIDLNLPRTWSSELLTSMFNNSFFLAKAESQKDQKVMLLNTNKSQFSNLFQNTKGSGFACRFTPCKAMGWNPKKKRVGSNSVALSGVKQQTEPNILPPVGAGIKWNVTQKNFFRFSLPFYFSDFFRFPVNENSPPGGFNTEFYESAFPLTNIGQTNDYFQLWNNKELTGRAFEKKNSTGGSRSRFNETKLLNSKIIVYGEKPLLKNRTLHGPPLKNQKESISLPNYLKNITNQNYQNLCPNNLNELYSVFWILFNKTLFIYLSLYYLRKFISFLGTEYIRNLFKIFVTMKFIDGNILSIIKTFQDFNFQLNQQNVIDIKVNKQLKEIKRN